MFYFTFPSSKIVVRVILCSWLRIYFTRISVLWQERTILLDPFLVSRMKYRCRLLPSYYFQCAGDRSNGGENLVPGQQAGAGLVTRALPFSLTISTIMPRPCIVTSVITNRSGVLVGKSISISEKKLSGREANLGLVRLSNAEPKIEKIIWFNFLISCSQFSHVRACARDPIKS